MSNKQEDLNWQKLKDRFYGQKICVQTSEWGIINFDPDLMTDVVGGEKLTYNEYLDILKKSGRNVRHWLEQCYYEIPLGFAGQVEKLIKKIFVSREFMFMACIWTENALMVKKNMYGCPKKILVIARLAIALDFQQKFTDT